MMTAPDDNSGIFVAFPDPEQQNYDNTAYVGVNFGFEVQIDELARPECANPPNRCDLFVQGADRRSADRTSPRRVERMRDYDRWSRLHGGAQRAGRQSLSLHRRPA